MQFPQVSNVSFSIIKLQTFARFTVSFLPVSSGWMMEHTMRRSSLKSRITRITRLECVAVTTWVIKDGNWIFHHLHPFIAFIVDFPMNYGGHFPMNEVESDLHWFSTFFQVPSVIRGGSPPDFRYGSDAKWWDATHTRAQQHPHHAEAAQEAGVGQALGWAPWYLPLGEYGLFFGIVGQEWIILGWLESSIITPSPIFFGSIVGYTVIWASLAWVVFIATPVMVSTGPWDAILNPLSSSSTGGPYWR